jgi:integrase/recombinase XerD
MFQQLFSSESACRRHGDAPFSDERERYLQHCAEQGSTRATLRVKANELLWLAQHLESNASDGVDMEALQDIVRERQSVYQGATTAQRLVDIARPWLRFLGWWRVPVAEFRFQNELDRYVVWMRDERGLSRLTVERWQAHARIFLLWCEQTDQSAKAAMDLKATQMPARPRPMNRNSARRLSGKRYDTPLTMQTECVNGTRRQGKSM